MIRHFLFKDYDTGEDFLVGAPTFKEAKQIARDIFADPSFVCEFSEFEAENSGLDEY